MAEPPFDPKLPASIRYDNPGAMWGGKHAQRWGATDTIGLHDGLGQGNNIAVFPTKTQGAAAQFDLWRRLYTGISLAEAVRRWSGGNSSTAYVAFLAKSSGIDLHENVTPALLASRRGLALMKAQAAWEAGRIKDGYPMSDAEWMAAQNMVFAGANPASPPAPPAPPPSPPAQPTTQQPFSLIAWLLSMFRGK